MKETDFFNSLLLETVSAASFFKLIVCLFNRLTSTSLLWIASFSHSILPGRRFFSHSALYKDFLFFPFLLFSSSMAITSQARSREWYRIYNPIGQKVIWPCFVWKRRPRASALHVWSRQCSGTWFRIQFQSSTSLELTLTVLPNWLASN